MNLYANLRPVKVDSATADRSPLKREAVEGVDLLIVRELVGGLYFGARTRTADRATDECVYTTAEIERVAHVAFTCGSFSLAGCGGGSQSGGDATTQSGTTATGASGGDGAAAPAPAAAR